MIGPRQDTTDFTVTGKGNFPFDMLRTDECWPADAVTASMLATAGTDRHQRMMKFRTSRSINVHPKRWDSFNWTVVAIDSERYGDMMSWHQTEPAVAPVAGSTYSVRQQADGSYAVFNGEGYVRGGFKQEVSALDLARDLAEDAEFAAGVKA
jgi:hypothetical protein